MKRFSTIIDDAREQFGFWFSRALIVLVLLFLFFVAGGGVSHKEMWKINSIDILGTGAVPEDIARSLVRQKLEGNYFFVYARDNSYLFSRREIKKMLYETFPRIASVYVGRSNNNAIVIEINERKPYALWCGLGIEETSIKDCWFIDEAGFVFDKAPVFSKGVYMETYGKLIEKNVGEPLRASLPQERFIIANSFAKLIDERIGKMASIFLKPDDEIDVTIGASDKHQFLANVAIRFNDDSDPLILIKNLEKAIFTQFQDNTSSRKKLQYIDMRFGNKVIFGFEN